MIKQERVNVTFEDLADNIYIEGAEVIESGNVFHREVTYGKKE